MIKLVLFDIDGTLIRTDGAGVRAFGRAMATQFKVPADTSWLSFAGRTDYSLVRDIFLKRRIAATPENFQLFFDCYAHWLEHLLANCDGAVCPGVRRLLAELGSLPEPPKIGLLTGNVRLGAEIKLRRFQLWDAFVTGAFADDHEDRTEIAAVARDRGGRLLGKELRGHEIVVIGDTPRDIGCGRAIQAKVLAVATGNYTQAELQEHAPSRALPNLETFSADELLRL